MLSTFDSSFRYDIKMFQFCLILSQRNQSKKILYQIIFDELAFKSTLRLFPKGYKVVSKTADSLLLKIIISR